MTPKPRFRWWIVVFFVAEFVGCFALLIHTMFAKPEDVWIDAVIATVIIGVAALIAVGRRLWQCWRIIREAYRAGDR